VATFINTVSSNLRELRSRLREYALGERGITVIKELVQNADDAGATRLEFVLFDGGDSRADNSLLRGPGLLVFNDGPFRREHEQNFTRPAGTSKSQDASAVGRFGIGLKSVFHLCEAWFWLGMSEDEGELHGVLNPWADPRSDKDHERPDWNHVTDADFRALRGAVEGLRTGDSWLAQWLPLRQAGHRRDNGGLILDHTWSVADLLADLSDLSPLAELLPQLGGLKSIRLLRSQRPGVVPDEVASVRAEAGAGRLGRPKPGASLGVRAKEGKVVGRGPRGTWELRYWIGEAVVSEPGLDELHRHESWPKVPDEGNDEGRPIFVKDKVIRHGAVTILRSPVLERDTHAWPPAGFGLGWAAFLPLGEVGLAPLADECGAWSVRLHGAFFPDHGRRHPLGFAAPVPGATRLLPELFIDASVLRAGAGDPRPRDHRQGPLDDWFRTAWNRRLAESATIPLLLETLARALASERSQDRAEAVVRAFADLPLVAEARDSVTRRGQLVVDVRGASQKVELVRQECRVVSVPRTERGGAAWKTLVRDAIGRVEAMPDSPVVTWSDAPGVLARGSFDRFTDAELECLLGDATAQALGTSGAATEWVAELLVAFSVRDPQRASSFAESLLRLVLSASGSAGLRNAHTQAHWRRIVDLVSPHARFETEAWKAIDLLDQRSSQVLILPIECRPSEASPGSPGRRWPGVDWPRTLIALHEAVEHAGESLAEDVLRDVGLLAAGIMREVGLQTVLADPRVRDRRLFSARSSRSEGRVLVSAGSLRSRLCFQRAGMVRPDSLADKVFRAIDGKAHDVLLVSDQALAKTLSIPALSEERILRVFLGEQALSPAPGVGPRSDLLDSLLTPTALATLQGLHGETLERHPVRRGIRLLLAGDERAEISVHALLVEDGHLQLSTSGVRRLLEIQQEGWRLLEEAVLGSVTQPWRRVLGIQTATAALLRERLTDRTDEELEALCKGLETADRDGLLLVAKDNEELWRRLPAHCTTGGGLVSANHPGLKRLQEGHRPPDVLLGNILTLDPSSNDTVARLQRERIETWGPDAAVKLAVHIVQRDGSTSATIAVALMDAFSRLQDDARARLAEQVSGAAWLPRLDGEGVSPADLLDLPETLASRAQGLLAGQEECFVLPDELLPEVRSHATFPAVVALGSATPRDAVEGLALRVGSLSAEQLEGVLLGPSADVLLPADLATRAEEPLSTDAGWGLLLAAADYLGEAGYPEGLVDVLTGPLRPGRLAGLLQLLRGHATPSQPGDGSSEAHRHLLGWLARDAVLSGLRATVLEHVELPNAVGEWVSPAQLTAIDNARPDYRLHPLWAEALRLDGGTLSDTGETTRLSGRDPATEVAASRGALEAYFKDWHAFVTTPALGLFVAMLGDGRDGGVRELAQSWLGALATVTNVRKESQLDAKVRRWNAGELAVRNTTEAQLAVAVLHEGTIVTAPNLLGQPIQVPVGAGAALESLLIGALEASTEPQWLLLADLNPAATPPSELLRLLRQACHAVHVQLTGQSAGPRLDQLWDRLEAGGQVQVEVTRRMIRRELPAQLRLMGLAGSDPVAKRLATAVKAYRHHEQTTVELNLADDEDPDKASDRVHRRNKAREDAEDALQSLETLIEGDAAHQFLLGRVRERLREEQYDLDRVPFELFQNADDALAQLEAMMKADGRALPDAARRFELEVNSDGDVLRFWHWGRGINRHYLGPGFTAGRDLGYDQDLLHMMLLHASDKGEQEKTTGRFGLGFKSVHLVSDGVRVQSERLAFRVRAGFLPVPIEVDESWLERRVERLEPTVVELPLGCSASKVVASFDVVAGLLPVFAQAVTNIAMRGREYAWRPRLRWTVNDAPGTSVAVGDAASGTATGQSVRLLVIQEVDADGPSESFVVGLRAGRMEGLAGDVPTIWCTAPTSQRMSTGWCLNGPFQVDVGRSQLGRTLHHTAANHSVARSIGRRVAAGLQLLAQLLEQDWAGTCEALLLPVDAARRTATLTRFWRSAWEQLSQGLVEGALDGPDSALLREFGRGWFGAFSHGRLLPTRLGGAWEGLTAMSEVEWVADEALARVEIAEKASNWSWLGGKYPLGTVVHPEVREVVRQFRKEWKPPRLTLRDLVKESWAGGKVLSAGELAALAPLYAWLNDVDAPLPLQLGEGIRQDLTAAKMRSAGTRARPAGKLLLVPLADDVRVEVRRMGGKRATDDLELTRDEQLLAGFAPDDWVLHPDIRATPGALLVYLEARREQPGVDAPEVAGWARAAEAGHVQRAVLNYLADGKRAKELGRLLVEHRPLWAQTADALRTSGLLSHLEVDQVARVMALLFPAQVAGKQENAEPPPPTVSLRAIHDWWTDQRLDFEQHFHEREWPPEWHDQQHLAAALGRETVDEEGVDAWMTFLLLASLRSLGRATAAHHTGFLQRLKEEGAWEVFLKDPRLEPDEWTAALREWEDRARDQPQFQRWWMFFPVAHQLRGHLEIYVRVLRRVGHPVWNQRPLRDRVKPRVADVYSGAGRMFDAPFLPAGIGVHWLLREMSRLGLGQLPGTASAFGWVPDAELRRVFFGLGLELAPDVAHGDAAARMTQFVGKHSLPDPSLEACFCVPLRIVTRSPELCAELGLVTPAVDPSTYSPVPSTNDWEDEP